MTAAQRWCSLGILAVAFALRVWALDYKPAHFDEGVNGSIIDRMRVEGCHRYNPENFHGPLHFYVLFAGQQLFGRSVTVLRMPTVLIGTAAVLLVLGLRRFLGFRAAAWAAAALAVSPAMVFYSRYAIHEMWLPFFAVLAIHGAFGIAGGGRDVRDLWRVGAGLAGMILTKETYILHFTAAFLAWVVIWLFQKSSIPSREARPRPAALFGGGARVIEPEPAAVKAQFAPADIARVVLVCFGAVVVFYSGFFMHWEGVAGLVSTFSAMLAKGTGGEEGHNKEMLYWLKLLAHYEWPALAGLGAALLFAMPRSWKPGIVAAVSGLLLVAMDVLMAGGARAQKPEEFLLPALGLHEAGSIGVAMMLAGLAMCCSTPAGDARIRWLALYALGSLAAYSLIPYKTPWCIVNVVLPLSILLGIALDSLAQSTKPFATAAVGLLLLAAPSVDTLRLNFNDRTQRPNPTLDSLHSRPDAGMLDGDRYAYVQTSFDINNLLDPLDRLTRASATNRQLVGHVYGDAFPLIWLLGDYPNVHFHDTDAAPETCDADFLLIPERLVFLIEPQLRGIYYRQPHRTRGGGENAWLYLLAERFQPVMPPEREPEYVPRVVDEPR